MATRSSTLKKTKDGSLIYQRRLSSMDVVSPASSYGPQPDAKMTGVIGKRSSAEMSTSPVKRRRSHLKPGHAVDVYCWVCHLDCTATEPSCRLCPRIYHNACLGTDRPGKDWVCPECQGTMKAECVDTQSRAMSMIQPNTLCVLLKFAITRIKQTECDDFCQPVDLSFFPNYKDYIIHPMDLSLMEKNISKRVYGSTEAFMADCKWIYHNSFIFNGPDHAFTVNAKSILKICKHEMDEIEICPDCYMRSSTHTDDNWFCEPCSKPHPLVWAKMKGYPHWPAKVLRQVNTQVDVRFFGDHDRSWVPLNVTYCLSKDPPVQMKVRKAGFDKSIKELNLHIKKLREQIGTFQYAASGTSFNMKEQFQQMRYRQKYKRRSSSPKAASNKSSPSESPTKTSLKTRPPCVSSPQKAGNDSIATKTASAVKLKYNSIIFTRRAAAAAGKTSPEKDVKSDSSPIMEEGSCVRAESEEAEAGEDEGNAGSSREKTLSDKMIDTSCVLINDGAGENSSGATTAQVLAEEQGPGEKEADSAHMDTGANAVAMEADAEDETCVNDETIPTEMEADSSPQESSEQPSKTDPDSVQLDAVSSRDSSSESTNHEMKGTEIAMTYSPSKPKTSFKDVLKRIKEKIEVAENDTETSQVDTEAGTEMLDEDVKASKAEDGESEMQASCGNKNRESLNQLMESCRVKLGISMKKEASEHGGEIDDDNDDVLLSDDTSDLDDSADSEMSEGDVVSDPSTGETISDEEEEEETDDKSAVVAQAKKPRIDIRKLKAMASKQQAGDDVSTETSKKSKQWKKQQLHRKAAKWELRRKFALFKRNALRKKLSATSPEPIPQQEFRTIGDVTLVSCSDTQNKIGDEVSDKVSDKVNGEVSDKVSGEVSDKVSDTMNEESNASQKSNTSNVNKSLGEPEGGVYPATEPVTIDIRGFDVAQYTRQMMGTLESAFTHFCKDMLNNNRDSAVKRHFQLELDRIRWHHQQEIQEVNHNTELALAEMRFSLEMSHERAIEELKQKAEKEKSIAIDETKKKQWCAKCGKEAIFYCCWNTSYCDYPCQQTHWPEHMPNCVQSSSDSTPCSDSATKTQPTLEKSTTVSRTTTSSQTVNKTPASVAQEKARNMLTASMHKPHSNELIYSGAIPRHVMGSPVQQGSPLPHIIAPGGPVAMVPSMQPHFGPPVGFQQRVPVSFTQAHAPFIHPSFQTFNNAQVGGPAQNLTPRPDLVQSAQRFMYSVLRPRGGTPIPLQNPVVITPTNQRPPINIMPSPFTPKTG